jgi:hypothetical protein
MAELIDLKLGLLPPQPDSRTLMLSDYLNVNRLPVIPKKAFYDCGITEWGMMLNDKIGCCAIAGPGHMIEAWTNGMTIVPDLEVLKAYMVMSGYDPETGRNDYGCILLDVLKYWANTGIYGKTIGAFAEVHKNIDDFKAALYLFHGLDAGVALPASAIDQFRKGKPWTTVRRSPIEGGHCIIPISYDETYVYAITWGKIVQIEWKWIYKYLLEHEQGEAFATISNDYIIGGKTMEGFDITTLNEDLFLIKASISHLN